MFIYLVLLVLITNVASKSNNVMQINLLHQVVNDFICSSTGIHLYFCEAKDAESILRYYLNGAHAVNSHLLQSVRSTQDIQISLQQPQVQQVFVDLSCQQGLSLLQQSQQLFNSSYRWLLWTQDYNRTLKQLHRCRVLLDSSVSLALFTANSVTVYDLYKMHRSLPFTVTPVKHWSAAGLSYPLQVPRPRNDFMGVNINCSVVIRGLDPTVKNFVQLLLDPTYFTGVEAHRRFNLRLLAHIAEHYNFTTSFFYVTTWGTANKSGAYDGMVGQVQRGETEISGSYTLFFGERTTTIDYLMSVSKAKTSFFFLQPKTIGTYKALLVPLEPQTWALLFATVLVFIVLMSFKKISRGTWSENVLTVVSTISHQGASDIGATPSGQIFFLTLLIFSFILLQYYSIALLKGLILRAPNAIQNWEQLMNSDLELGVEDDAYLRIDFLKNDTKSVQIRAKMAKNKKLFYPVYEGLDKVRKGGFALHNIVLDNYIKLSSFSESEICSLSDIDKIESGHTGPIAEDNTPYKEIFRKIFDRLKENGIMDTQYRFWIPTMPKCHWRQERIVINAKALTIAFVVFASGCSISLVLFAVELCSFKKTENRLENTKPFLH